MARSITLSNGLVCLVDEDDFHRFGSCQWFVAGGKGKWYAARTVVVDGRRTTIYLHRLIAGEEGLEVDHINGDTLDNRRMNLRAVTHQVNQQNRRRGYGVTGERNVYHGRNGRYAVKLKVHGVRVQVGTFATLNEATEAASSARALHFGGG